MLPHLFTGGSGRDQRTSGMRCNAEAVFHMCIVKNKHFSSINSPSCVTYLNWEFAKNAVFFLIFFAIRRVRTWFLRVQKCASGNSPTEKRRCVRPTHFCTPHDLVHTWWNRPKSEFWAQKNLCARGGFWKSSVRVFLRFIQTIWNPKKRSKKGNGAHDNKRDDFWGRCGRWGLNGGLRLQLEPTSQRPSQDDAR